jgi:general secretion pathway protein I
MISIEREDGFTLAEIIVAFAILSLALLAIFQSYGLVARSTVANERERAALAVAQSLLATTGLVETVMLGKEEGLTSDGVAWSRTVTPYGQSPASATTRAYLVIIELKSRTPARHGDLIRLSTIKLLSEQ